MRRSTRRAPARASWSSPKGQPVVVPLGADAVLEEIGGQQPVRTHLGRQRHPARMADDAVEAQLGGPADGPLRRPVGVAEVVDPGPAQRLDRDLVRDRFRRG